MAPTPSISVSAHGDPTNLEELDEAQAELQATDSEVPVEKQQGA